jgi:1-acyl-sn-glycerol-3-phosphate acyltransferase
MLRALWRLQRALVHALVGYATIHLRFGRLPQAQRNLRVQLWAGRMLEVLGIELVVYGRPPQQGPILLVANHISWLDILVMHAARHCRFVSKADVKRWPLIGTLATGAGTLYIERESRRDAMRVVHHMAHSLHNGEIVAVFPEGTTSDGMNMLPFHANLLQAAISSQALAQPVGLRFVDAQTGETSLAPCYIGDDTLFGSLWRTLTAPGIKAVVRYGRPQHAQGRDRRRFASDLRDAVDALRTQPEPAADSD